MPDREKVIEHITDCVKIADCQINHNWVFVRTDILRDALELLKAQELRVMAGAELTDAELIEEIRKAPIVLKPNVDAVPVVHARWTTKRTWKHDGEWYCSACEYEPVVFMDSEFCPNCGAKMDGERRESE